MSKPLTPTQQRIWEAICRPEGLKSSDNDLRLGETSLKVHVSRIRGKGYKIITVHSARSAGQIGASPAIYYSITENPCAEILL